MVDWVTDWPEHSTLVLGALIAVAASAFGQPQVGINFSGRPWSIGGNNPQNLAPSNASGVSARQNWNDAEPGGADGGDPLFLPEKMNILSGRRPPQ